LGCRGASGAPHLPQAAGCCAAAAGRRAGHASRGGRSFAGPGAAAAVSAVPAGHGGPSPAGLGKRACGPVAWPVVIAVQRGFPFHFPGGKS
jgi:hypothetical protein